MNRRLHSWSCATVVVLCVALGVPSVGLATEMSTEAQLDAQPGSDLFVYDPATGAYIKARYNASGGYVNETGQFAPGLDTYLGHLNGDTLADVLLVDPVTGNFWSAINTPAGFNVSFNGTFPPGSLATLADFNGDRKHDLITYQPSTGAWQQRFNDGNGALNAGLNAGVSDIGYTYLGRSEFNDNIYADLFAYNSATGAWSKMTTNAGGVGFVTASGVWAPGGQVYPGRFNDDDRTDFFVYNPLTGAAILALCNGGGGFTQFASALLAGWSTLVFNMNGDDLGDLFLYNAVTGNWQLGINNGAGAFGFQGGVADTGLAINRINVNGDALSDLFAYNLLTGLIITAVNGPSGFSLSQLSGVAGLRILSMAAWFFAPGPPPFGPPLTSPPNMLNVVLQVSAQNPGLVGTCSHDNNAFIFAVLRALRQIDGRWGLNWKRGNTGDLSEDIVNYYRTPGGDPSTAEGSTDVWLFDIVSGCGSSGASPGWIDQTGATAAAGTIGRWTLRPCPTCLTGGQ